MELIISKPFQPLLDDPHRYLVLCGGRGSGKSEFAARKLFYRAMKEGGHRFLVMRKIRRTLKESVIRIFETLLAENKVAFEYYSSDRKIIFLSPDGKRNELLFEGLDDPEKIKSIKGITGIWIEEATEFSRDDFLVADLCLREPGPGYHQTILTFNPDEARAAWLKQMFFDEKRKDATVHVSTIDDNPIRQVREAYREQLEKLKLIDEALWKIYRLGQWAHLAGQIFSWDVVELPEMGFDEVFWGGDFGYSVDPAAVVKVYRRADEFWVEEKLYQTGLTNQQLGQALIEMGCREPIYFDAAEPKSIRELCLMGIDARPSEKGPDSVRAGIDFLRTKKIHIVSGSVNLQKEVSSYVWRKDKSGNPLNEPVQFNDHLISAVRYAITTHCRVDNIPDVAFI